MDSEIDLLADDGEFKDENLDDEVDEMALLGSSGDEDDTNQSLETSSSYQRKSQNVYSADDYDESDVLDVNIDEEENFTQEDLKDEVQSNISTESSKYKTNLISVPLVVQSNDDVEKRLEEENFSDSDNRHKSIDDDSSFLDEESDDENADDRRGRFKSERSALSSTTSSKRKSDIPDSLESVLSAEEKQKVDNYLENERKKMFNRQQGQFRRRNRQSRNNNSRNTRLNFPIPSGQLEPLLRNNVPPPKIHVNPHFRQNTNPPMTNMPQPFIQNPPDIIVSSSYNPPSHPNYAYNDVNFTYSENSRYSQLPPPPLVSGAIRPNMPFSQGMPLPNLQAPPPSLLHPQTYVHSNTPTDYLGQNPNQNQIPPNLPPNMWNIQHMPSAPQQIMDVPPPYNFPAYQDNSYRGNNYPEPTRQQSEGHVSHNYYENQSSDSPWYQDQRRTSSSAKQISPNAKSSPSQNYQNSNNKGFSRQKNNDQKRYNQQLQARKLVKRSANLPITNSAVKKKRFEDNQRKNSNIKEIPLVENLPPAKKSPEKEKSPEKPKPKVIIDEDDEETKRYREKIEQQKRLREAFLRRKEERRKLIAAEKSLELLKKGISASVNLKQIKTVTEMKTEVVSNVTWKKPVQMAAVKKTVITSEALVKKLTATEPHKPNTLLRDKNLTEPPKTNPQPSNKNLIEAPKSKIQLPNKNLTELSKSSAELPKTHQAAEPSKIIQLTKKHPAVEPPKSTPQHLPKKHIAVEPPKSIQNLAVKDPPQSNKIDLRSKISKTTQGAIIKISGNAALTGKKLSEKNKIRFGTGTPEEKSTLNDKTDVKTNINKTKQSPTKFRKPFLQKKMPPSHQKNVRPFQGNQGNQFQGHRTLMPNPQFPPNRMMNPMYPQNSRFPFDSQMPRPPLLNFPNQRMNFFQDQPPMNFNQRIPMLIPPGCQPEEFMLEPPRFPQPPQFLSPSQVFHKRPNRVPQPWVPSAKQNLNKPSSNKDKCDLTEEKKPPTTEETNLPESATSTVIVSNLSSSTNETQLRNLCNPLGPVKVHVGSISDRS